MDNIKSIRFNEQQVFELCAERCDSSALTAPNSTLCVDGTSCTMKTSILNATKLPVTKTNRLNRFITPNSYFPSMIGYITKGIQSLNVGGPHLNDRSPLNVLEWRDLWRIFDHFLSNNGLTVPTAEQLDIYRQFFRNLRDSYYYKHFRKQINAIAFVDSDVDRCDMLRFNRNQGSDTERSRWPFYTPLQNLMFKTLYPGQFIDMAWFHDTERSIIIAGVSKYLRSLFDILPNYSTLPIIEKVYLPTLPIDPLLLNISTHVHRAIGRHAVKSTLNDPDILPLMTSIPCWVDVEAQKHNEYPIRARKSDFDSDRNHLLQAQYITEDFDTMFV